jgi:hypothetical protein
MKARVRQISTITRIEMMIEEIVEFLRWAWRRAWASGLSWA